MVFTYTPHGVCSRQMELELENGVVRSLKVIGGCHGNLQGISALVVGQDARSLIDRLRGIDCGGKGTSCPDQLSKALEAALAAEAGQ